jgi:hypothetical protein
MHMHMLTHALAHNNAIGLCIVSEFLGNETVELLDQMILSSYICQQLYMEYIVA